MSAACPVQPRNRVPAAAYSAIRRSPVLSLAARIAADADQHDPSVAGPRGRWLRNQSRAKGRALRGRGQDVVIGFVQTHGRRRTEQAIGGLDIVPRRQAGGYDGTGGMDLDGVLARQPAVVLVDDYRRNAGAISSLRDAGIDVISTIDVCDLDRAADTVAEFTGPPATTTVPDTALAEADDIRFVDNSPEALRKRLGRS